MNNLNEQSKTINTVRQYILLLNTIHETPRQELLKFPCNFVNFETHKI